jgi:hypothetical protein
MGYSYGPSVVKNGMVLCLDAANRKSYAGSGTTWADISGYANNGTLTNGPTYTSSFGGSIVFDGSNDHIVVQDNNVFDFGTGDFAVEAWIYPRSISADPTIFLAQSYFTGNSGAILYIAIGGSLGVYTTSLFTESAASISTNQWYHIVWTRISGTSYLYNNTILRDSRAFTTSISVNNKVVFGYDTQYNNGPFNGFIPLCRIYSGKGLSASEVLQNYNATKGRFGL